MRGNTALIVIVVIVAVVVAVLLGLFLYMNMTRPQASVEKPKIIIGEPLILDYGNNKAYARIRLISTSDKAYAVDIKVEGCVSKTYHDVVVSPGIKDLTISIPYQKIIQGCRLKVYIIYNGEVIDSKTFNVKP